MNNNLTENKEFNEALIRRQIEIYSGMRKNFSEESEKIMDKVRRGDELSASDVFTLICDDENKINEYKTFADIKERVKDGKISPEDLNFLIKKLEIGDKELENLMYNLFDERKITKK